MGATGLGHALFILAIRSLQLGECLVECRDERRHVGRHGQPDFVHVYPDVVVRESIPHAANSMPRNRWETTPRVVANPRRDLPNHNQRVEERSARVSRRGTERPTSPR